MSSPEVLLMGMVYSENLDVARGQEYRDYQRCLAMEKMGYKVKTLDLHSDNKSHATESVFNLANHITGNFNNPRRPFKSIRVKWGSEIIFQKVFLDYFFSPIGWARDRWTDTLFSKTIPGFAKYNMIEKGGEIWFPFFDFVDGSILKFKKEIEKYYTIRTVSDPDLNDLYRATGCEDVEALLLACPDKIYNANQLAPIKEYSETPFVCFTRRYFPMIYRTTHNVKQLTYSYRFPNDKSRKASNKRRTKLQITKKRFTYATLKHALENCTESEGITEKTNVITEESDITVCPPLPYEPIPKTSRRRHTFTYATLKKAPYNWRYFKASSGLTHPFPTPLIAESQRQIDYIYVAGSVSKSISSWKKLEQNDAYHFNEDYFYTEHEALNKAEQLYTHLKS